MRPDERIAAYKEAYAAANEGREIEIGYRRGWYHVYRTNSFGYHYYRAAQLDGMIRQLSARKSKAATP